MKDGLNVPGVYFLPPRRPARPGLPRLDTAAFVGFAARGPLDWPILVEDFKTYQAIFGGDLPVAREPGGPKIYANLAGAVAAFFANGGRRCYVVRVAGEQSTCARFSLPGVVALGDRGEVRLASVQAATAGRWAGNLSLSARLSITPLPDQAFTTAPHHLVWSTGSAPQAIVPGDLLRLALSNVEQWFFPVAEVRPAPQAGNLVLTARKVWKRPQRHVA